MQSTLSRLPAWVASVCLATATVPLAQQHKPAPGFPKASPSTPDEIYLTRFEISPTSLDFGPTSIGQSAGLDLSLKNLGHRHLELQSIELALGPSGNSAAFKVTINGNDYLGGASTTLHTLQPPLSIPRGEELVATVTFAPTEQQLDSFRLTFVASDLSIEIPVGGLGGHAGDPFLHVVMDGPPWIVDYDEDGNELLVMDGTGSHTHEPGHSLTAYEWRVDGQVVATTTGLSTMLSQPTSEIQLEIFDSNVPAHTLVGEVDVRVVAPDAVPGVLVHYYDASGSGPVALLDAVPSSSDYIQQLPSMSLGGAGQVGNSPFTGNVLVRMVGSVQLPTDALYDFIPTGGADRRFFLDSVEFTEPIFLFSGPHQVEARFAVESLSDLPLDVALSYLGNQASISAESLTHSETATAPVIHSMTPTGVIAGGDAITIDGFGFFPPQQVVVHWGTMDLIAADFTSLSPTRIQFPSPAGGGAIAVSVETANGPSNVRGFLYQLSGPPPVQFRRDLIVDVPSPTAGVWGPDGKLYVASVDGRITVLQFDEDYELVSQTIHTGLSGLVNHDTLALAINPFEASSPLKLYVGHGDHFVNGGETPTSFSPYTGQISVLTGPNFDSPVPLITGLPVSNHDHAINGIVFDSNGDLLISVGSQTNAGVPAPLSGDLPESPLSAAILKARLSKPGFNGTITYVETSGGLPNNDQRYGDIVDVAAGIDVSVHAAGMRNAFGLVYTTGSLLYGTDNGPNIGFGPTSTGPESQGAEPYDDDELNLIEWGNYYGSPNRNRGRTDARQNIYYGGLAGPPSIPDTLFQMVAWLPPSSDGIDEYRANTFEGQMRGNLVVQKYQNKMRRVFMKADGRGSTGQATIEPSSQGLSCLTGPGGAIVSLDFVRSEVEIFEADDLTPTEFVVHDIFPWRAPASGGTPFVIAGRGFGTLATTSVTIGGTPATLTSASWGRIHGIVPLEAAPTTAQLDVVVTVGQDSSTLTKAFRYLIGPGLEPGRWESLTSLSSSLREIAAGVISGKMYMVGEGSTSTLAYDVQNRQWLSDKAARPFIGHHHAAEVVNGKLFLIGGINGGSEGRVQIYDPVTNSWTTGASMSWSGGSVSTAVIGGKIYAAGGIVTGGFTVTNCAEYDPIADTWTAKTAMPDMGRNHAAAGTDGSKLYVFGGRRGGNFVANGYDSVMVYDPVADTWTWNGAPGSPLLPLPEARGGMGKAVWLRGEFYVFGGETLNDPDANLNGVYDRVDVYNPTQNTWRLEKEMPNPRHGIFPVLYQGHVFLAGGGATSGSSGSTVFDTFTRQ